MKMHSRLVVKRTTVYLGNHSQRTTEETNLSEYSCREDTSKTHSATCDSMMHGDHRYDKYVKDNPSYVDYITKNGMHFTDTLAEDESAKMVNNSAPHKWPVKQVVAAVSASNPSKKFKHKMTDGDLTYGANMFYADLYPEAIQVDTGCIEAVKLIGNDKDGYEGQLFCRWLTDVMMQDKKIDWHKYCSAC